MTVGLCTPFVSRLAGRIGQRPILLAGGAIYASSGAYRLLFFGTEVDYPRDHFPSMALSGIGVASVFPQLSSVVAQARPGGPKPSLRPKAHCTRVERRRTDAVTS